MKTKLLFVCSANQWRSPTAESLFKNHPRYEARSAGRIALSAAKERKERKDLRFRLPCFAIFAFFRG